MLHGSLVVAGHKFYYCISEIHITEELVTWVSSVFHYFSISIQGNELHIYTKLTVAVCRVQLNIRKNIVV